MKTKIYVAAHKPCKCPNDSMYTPIQVGAQLHPIIPEFPCHDNTGDNISNLNSSFNEITALYWIWKNSDADVVGLAHYRRLFYMHRYCFPNKDLLTEKNIEESLKNSDIILPKKEYTKNTTLLEYSIAHNNKDFLLTRDIIKELNPEYIQSFDIVSQRKWMYFYNMFVTSKQLFSEYMSWLMPILFKLHTLIDTTNYDSYNSRVVGFLAERLFNV